MYGTLSGMANKHVDRLMMKATDLFMSIPALLLVIVLEAIWGEASYTSLSLVIGITSWMQMSKVIRSEVIRLRKSEFVIAAEMYGGSFWYILRRHLFPNYFSSIMFMAVSNVGSAIIVESTLSFMGLGLPISEMSWGSLMSLSQDGTAIRPMVDDHNSRTYLDKCSGIHNGDWGIHQRAQYLPRVATFKCKRTSTCVGLGL